MLVLTLSGCPVTDIPFCHHPSGFDSIPCHHCVEIKLNKAVDIKVSQLNTFQFSLQFRVFYTGEMMTHGRQNLGLKLEPH